MNECVKLLRSFISLSEQEERLLVLCLANERASERARQHESKYSAGQRMAGQAKAGESAYKHELGCSLRSRNSLILSRNSNVLR